jgi:hypothetical protein
MTAKYGFSHCKDMSQIRGVIKECCYVTDEARRYSLYNIEQGFPNYGPRAGSCPPYIYISGRHTLLSGPQYTFIRPANVINKDEDESLLGYSAM